MTALFPGSFDPITRGHIDIIERAARIFGTVIIAVFDNPVKKPLFDLQGRIELIYKTTRHLPNVKIDAFSGLLVDYAKNNEINVLIRGVRTIADFEIESQRAAANRLLGNGIEMLLLVADPKYSMISSSMVREIAITAHETQLEAYLRPVVPSEVIAAISAKKK